MMYKLEQRTAVLLQAISTSVLNEVRVYFCCSLLQLIFVIVIVIVIYLHSINPD